MKFYKKYIPLLQLNNSQYDVIVLTGGRGSLKTGHALRGILTCSTQAKKRTCFFRETKDTLTNSIKAELDGLLETEFINRGYTSTNDCIRHDNGSYMFFKGLKEVNTAAIENLKGIASTTDFFVVDEAQAVSKPVWDVLLATLRKAGCVLIAIYNRIDLGLPVEEALFIDYDTMSAPEGTYFVEVNYPEIEHLGLLSSQFLNRAKLVQTNKPEEYNQVYLNQPNSQHQAKVVKYWTSDNIKPVNYLDELDMHITCDFNLSPNCWLTAHKTTDKVFYFDEFCLDMPTEDLIKVVLDKYDHPNRIIINGDASGDFGSTKSKYSDYALIQNELIRRGYRRESELIKTGKRFKFDVRTANGAKKVRFSSWNAKVFDDNGDRCIIADPKCKWLDYNCKNLKIIPGTSEYDIPTVTKIKTDLDLKYLGHVFDAASYLVNTYWNLSLEKEPTERVNNSLNQNNFNHLTRA